MPTLDEELEQERRAHRELWERMRELERENAELKESLETIRVAAHMPCDYKFGLPSWINQVLYRDHLNWQEWTRHRISKSEDIETIVRLRRALKTIAERLPSEDLQAALLAHEPRAGERAWHQRLWELEKIAKDALTSNTGEMPKGA